MSKPAVDALNRIRANHPGATVVERHESSITADVGDGKRALVSHQRAFRAFGGTRDG